MDTEMGWHMGLAWDHKEMRRASIIRQTLLPERLEMMRRWKQWIKKEMERKPEDDIERIAKAFKALRISTDAASNATTKRARMNRRNWWAGGASHEGTERKGQ